MGRDEQDFAATLTTFATLRSRTVGSAEWASKIYCAASGSGSAGIVDPFLAFKLGVELGQPATVAVFLMLIGRVRTYPGFGLRWAPLGSVAGAYWRVTRTIIQ